MKNNAQLINQTSSNVEYFTLPKIADTAREFLSGIDLDPASCPAANQIIKADNYFTKDENGLSLPWHGRIWMNHPFGKKEAACTKPGPKCERLKTNTRHKCHNYDFYGNKAWIDKLISEYQIANVEEALCITYALTSEAWFQPLMQFPQCFLCPRTNYYGADGQIVKGVTKGSVITYLGGRTLQFWKSFQKMGTVKVVLVENSH